MLNRLAFLFLLKDSPMSAVRSAKSKMLLRSRPGSIPPDLRTPYFAPRTIPLRLQEQLEGCLEHDVRVSAHIGTEAHLPARSVKLIETAHVDLRPGHLPIAALARPIRDDEVVEIAEEDRLRTSRH